MALVERRPLVGVRAGMLVRGVKKSHSHPQKRSRCAEPTWSTNTRVTGTFFVFLTVVRKLYVVTSLLYHTPAFDAYLPRLRYSTFTLASTPSELGTIARKDTEDPPL